MIGAETRVGIALGVVAAAFETAAGVAVRGEERTVKRVGVTAGEAEVPSLMGTETMRVGRDACRSGVVLASTLGWRLQRLAK